MNLELESYDPMAGTLVEYTRKRRLPFTEEAIPTPTRAQVSPPHVAVGKPEINTAVLALDLGTKTGYALWQRDGAVVHGTARFTPRANWSPGQKWQRFRAWLSGVIVQHHITQIAYEDVFRHLGVDAAHAYGGYLAMLEMVADQHNVTLVAVGVGTIKKHWTGKGNAKKDEMIAEAKRRGFHPDTDNAADALAILSWAVAQERQS